MILGEATIRANGVELKTTGTAKLNPGGYKREQHKGSGKVRGLSEAFEAPYLECDVVADEDFDIVDLNAMNNATVTFEGNNGLSYMMTGSALENPATLVSDGKVSGLKFLGVKVKPM